MMMENNHTSINTNNADNMMRKEKILRIIGMILAFSGIAGIFLSMVLFRSVRYWYLILLLSFLISVVGFVIGIKYQNKLNTSFYHDVECKVKPVLASFMEVITFLVLRHIEDFDASSDWTTGDCFVYGKHEGNDVAFSNLRLCHCEKNATITDFKGLCVQYSAGRPISENTLQKIINELPQVNFYRITLRNNDVIEMMIQDQYYFINKPQIDLYQVKNDSELAQDAEKLSALLNVVAHAIREQEG